VNLRTAVFRWTAVWGAVNYRVVFGTVSADGRMNILFASFDIKSTSLRLGAETQDPEGNIQRMREHFVPGVIGEWDVDAFDSHDKRIGTTLGARRRFLVARGMGTD
jgi:hypothetical protein